MNVLKRNVFTAPILAVQNKQMSVAVGISGAHILVAEPLHFFDFHFRQVAQSYSDVQNRLCAYSAYGCTSDVLYIQNVVPPYKMNPLFDAQKFIVP